MIQLFDQTVEQLTRGLSFASARHTLLAQNLANVETPTYRARDLVFDDYLQPSIELVSGDLPPGLLPIGLAGRRPRLVATADRPARSDGNNVHFDFQMARLAENTMYQQTLVQILANQFTTLKLAISGRV